MASPRVQTAKHRKTHKVQTWVNTEMKRALVALARDEGRTVANLVRREISKLTKVAE